MSTILIGFMCILIGLLLCQKGTIDDFKDQVQILTGYYENKILMYEERYNRMEKYYNGK